MSVSSPVPTQGFRPTPPTWKGYVPTPESAVFITRPVAKLAYLYGLVVQISPDGTEKPAYENIVRLEPSGGLTVPYCIGDDGLTRIGLRQQFRVFIISDFGRYDAANAAHGKRLAELEERYLSLSAKEADAGKGFPLGARLLAAHEKGGETWAAIEPQYVIALSDYVEDLKSIGFGRWSWEVPGGYGAYGEKRDEAARRQFYEEITAKHVGVVPGTWQSLGIIVGNRGHEAYPIHILAVRVSQAHVNDPANMAASAKAKPDPFDPKNPLTYFDADGLRKLAEEELLICGLTEAAIGRFTRHARLGLYPLPR